MESKFHSKIFFSTFPVLLVCIFAPHSSHGKVDSKVRCLPDAMVIDLVKTDTISQIYLDQLKNYPDEECHAKIDGSIARFHLSLTDIHRCGVTRIFNQMNGMKVYYHKIVIEHSGEPPHKEYLLVKCSITGAHNHTVSKRNVLPAGFTEPEDLEVTTTLTGKAPEPMLSVAVRQGKEQVSGELNVNPGTPLTMQIFLDKTSAPIYGVLVSYMQVTDTKNQEETIIFNGCSVDPYLFENFNTINGDFLSAKFRAFKFPDSTYVQFRGTVNVCLDKCRGVQCSNGQTGYGRRRRDVQSMPADPNKLFEVSLTTFIKINFLESKMDEPDPKKASTLNETESVFILKHHLLPNGQMIDEIREEEKGISLKGDNSIKSGAAVDLTGRWNDEDEPETLGEDLKYAVVMERSGTPKTTPTNVYAVLVLAILVSFSIFSR